MNRNQKEKTNSDRKNNNNMYIIFTFIDSMQQWPMLDVTTSFAPKELFVH